MVTIYDIKNRSSRICHEGHFGGALLRLLCTAVYKPQLLVMNFWIFGLLILVGGGFIWLVNRKPQITWGIGKKKTRLDEYKTTNEFKNEKSKQQELDELLDKVGVKGYDRLSQKEKERLKELSGN